MGTITLPNFRTTADVTMNTRLKDGGVAIDWAGLSNIKAWLYSDAQKAIAGRCDVSIDQTDSTKLVCEYSATKPQYLGVQRLVIQAKYHGRTKTYDKPVFNFVPRTADQEGAQIVIDDPEVDVEIEVEDVSSSILDNILAACIKATEEAREVVDVGRGPRGYSAYQVAVQNGFVGTEDEWLESLVGPGGKSAYQLAADQGYEGTLPEWLASLHGADGDSAYEVAVQEGFVGTKAQWLASLVGPQGLSAYQVAVVDGYQGTVSEWLASLVGPVGPTPVFTIGTVETAAEGEPASVTITGTPSAPVLNLKLPRGLQGNTGSSVAFPYELVNNRTTDDATKGLSAAEGKRLGDDLSQLEHELNEMSNTEAVDLDEEIKVISEDGQTTILEITENGVDAKNLKSNGAAVLTSHQDISGLATKTELEEGLAEKQDIIEELSIGEDMPASFTGSEMDFSSDDESEVYARVDENGISAKGFRLLSGETLKIDPLGGKKWAVLGDSFTDGATSNTIPSGQYAGKRKVYPYFIGNRTGIDVISTFFASGRTLAWPANPGNFVNSICNPNAAYYYQNIPADVDYITIYLGINDSHHSPGGEGGDGEDNTGEIPIGTITDNTTATYYGAWNVVLTWLRTNRPFAHIGIIVSNGCDEMEYRTAQIAVAKKYGIPYLDLNGDERCQAMIRPQNDDIPSSVKTIIAQAQAVNYPTNTHPNDDAHLFESYFIENFLRTI